MSNDSDQWKYQVCGTEFGPVSFELLAECAASGQLGPDDLVCGPRGNWQPAGDIVGLIPDEPTEEFELPSIAEENTAARVVRPIDAAKLSTQGPTREQAIGPKSLGATTPRKAPRPESMQDAISSMLASAESVGSDEAQSKVSVAPQRQAVPAKQAPAAAQAKAVASPKPSAETQEQSKSPSSDTVVDTQREAEPEETPAISSSPSIASPVSVQPQPTRPQVMIPQSKSSRFDPDTVKRVAFALAGCAAIGLVVVIGKPLLAGSGASGNPIEVQWQNTKQLVDSLIAASEANDLDAMLRFRRDFPTHSQKIVSRLEQVRQDGRDTVPSLTTAMLALHKEAIPNFLADASRSPETKLALRTAIERAEEAGEG